MQLNFTFFSSIARICFCACLLVMLPAHAKRLALVMGNDNYTSVTKLQKAGNDATALARELKAAGFTVQLHKDLNYRGMVKAVETFTNSITGGDEVVVFYAGHGVQIKTGSYLLPTDIEASSESEVEKTAYELNALTDKISEAKPAFSLVMVDACRDNPLKAKGRSVGNTRGLSAVEPPKGQMVVYSASRGQQALDRLSDSDANLNGVFTREFIARMKKPGVKIEDLMKEVQDSVETLAKSINHEQRPAIYNEARGNFYFFGPTTVQTSPSPPVSNKQHKEEKFWEDVKLAGNKEAYEAYLQRYPAGIYAYLAKANILRLSDISKPPVNQPTIPETNQTETKLIGDAETQKLIQEATIRKDAKAQYNLGNRYFNGTGGLTKDLIQAEKFFRLAADQGESNAQVSLGDFYRNGLGGLNKNFAEAFKLYQLSVNQGNPRAQDILGWLYAYGQAGLVKDEVQAEKLFRLSADQKNFNGQYNLGVFYVYGRGGLPKDEVQAEKLFRLAANQGNPNGHFMLGIFYLEGRGGLVKDEAEAIRLFKLAASKNNQYAQEQLRKLGATW